MWLGIDFSGNDKMWAPGGGRSNVWIAAVEDKRGKPVLCALIARAWPHGALLDYGAPQFPEEGWIAVGV